MNESAINLGEVSISAAREQSRTTVNIPQISVSQKQIKALPSVGGEADIVQYLQVIPGIISTGDQGGQIYIRGGAPVQNKIQLDGLNIFNPFHSIGFYSVFETELIKNVDVLTGGFGAEYGGRISAIVDIKTREGNKGRTSGFVSGGPFLMKGMIEAGAAGVHFEDQLSSAKKCGHMGGKVLVSTREFINTLVSARLAADIMGVPTVLIARNDANSANLLTNDIDDRDKKFIHGERTFEGFFHIKGGIECAIDRGLSYAPAA